MISGQVNKGGWVYMKPSQPLVLFPSICGDKSDPPAVSVGGREGA